MQNLSLDNIEQFQQQIQNDPVLFLDGVLWCSHWSKQDEIIESVFKNSRTSVKSCHWVGKCLWKWTPILMYDWTIKKVEDIIIGDFIMWMNSKKRKVLNLTNWIEKLYKIIPKKWDSFLVTGNHKLTLRKGWWIKYNRWPIPNGTIIDISINDYLLKDKEFKTRYKLFRIPINFKNNNSITIDPYFLWLWLWDGNSNNIWITTIDEEIKKYTYKIAEKYDLKINININTSKLCPTYIISKWYQQKKWNKLLKELIELWIRNNKQIPLIYKKSSVKNRLKLIAWLIDTDWSLENNCYCITQKSKQLTEDIAFVCRSLWFWVTVREVKKSIKSTGFSWVYYSAIISWDINKIPVLLERKKAKPRRHEKNVLNIWFEIEKQEEWEYYWLQVDWDERFLLWDFTVTHNSYISARIAPAFLLAYPDSIVITTAPTFRQVENILWREMRQAIKWSSLGWNLLKVKYEIDEKRYALWLSSDKEDNFQGFHAEHLLVIVDEAWWVAEKTLKVIEALMTSKWTRILYIWNPTQASWWFYQSHKSELYHKISISCFDTPNFKFNNLKSVDDLKKLTREQVTQLELVYPELVTPMWVYERIIDWGEDSPMFQSRVLAIFPEEWEDTLIKLSHIEKSLEKEVNKEEYKIMQRRRCIWIDVARFWSDTTVLIWMNNKIMHEDIKFYKWKDTMQTVWIAIAFFNELWMLKEFDYFIVDDTGVGWWVTDRLLELWYNVTPINNASNPNDTETFRDIKAEIYWLLRQWFIDWDIKIYDVSRLIKDISNIKYDYTSQGKIFIKSKKDMKKEGLDSPDFADALALAYYGCIIADGWDSIVWNIEDTKKEEFTIVWNILKKRF